MGLAGRGCVQPSARPKDRRRHRLHCKDRHRFRVCCKDPHRRRISLQCRQRCGVSLQRLPLLQSIAAKAPTQDVAYKTAAVLRRGCKTASVWSTAAKTPARYVVERPTPPKTGKRPAILPAPPCSKKRTSRNNVL